MAATIREDLVVRRYHREGRRRAEYFCEDELRQRQALDEIQNGLPWIAGDVVVDRDETLYINGTRAEELGLVRHVVESQDEFRQRYGIDSKIRFNHRVKRASWSSPEARWTVEAERTVGEGAAEVVRFTPASRRFC